MAIKNWNQFNESILGISMVEKPKEKVDKVTKEENDNFKKVYKYLKDNIDILDVIDFRGLKRIITPIHMIDVALEKPKKITISINRPQVQPVQIQTNEEMTLEPVQVSNEPIIPTSSGEKAIVQPQSIQDNTEQQVVKLNKENSEKIIKFIEKLVKRIEKRKKTEEKEAKAAEKEVQKVQDEINQNQKVQFFDTFVPPKIEKQEEE
jgi:hypothetical protein